ncbi:hypothetical protein [Adhaeribacter aquaticus]|uniref:hypothetical protein n=1 Tax=Adhaeribacter aquaticus TaxID=299567 RepID=UPI00041BC065|nr:hypothetical protein [Adhaeribacter aquaticus]
MLFTPRISKAVLTTHITVSLGWFGAVVVFVVLAITGLTNQNTQVIRSCIIAMEITTRYVIIPFCLASLLTGILQSAFSKWGLFRYYWIVIKLLLTAGSTLLLFLHLKPIRYLAMEAVTPDFSLIKESETLINLISKAGYAIIVLLVITSISVYKPWGKIVMEEPTGKKLNSGKLIRNSFKKNTRLYFIIGIVTFILFLLVKHLLNGGIHPH